MLLLPDYCSVVLFFLKLVIVLYKHWLCHSHDKTARQYGTLYLGIFFNKLIHFFSQIIGLHLQECVTLDMLVGRSITEVRRRKAM